MTDPRSLRLAIELRERVAFRAQCDPPDDETAAWFAQQLAAIRDQVPRADVLRLEGLCEYLTGCKG